MEEILNVIWQKNNQNNEPFDLLRLDLSSPYFSGKKGVFVVWCITSPSSKVIKIGSGNLLEQLKNARSNPLVLQYSKNGPLKVSWIAVNGVLKEEQMLGVEAFLYDIYNPLLGEKNSSKPIKVKLIGQ